MPRSTTGCWTCRVRKKKCDNGRPCCSVCTFRSITCYGYDYNHKPSWIDGGEREGQMLSELKQQVKESYQRRRKRRATSASISISNQNFASLRQTPETSISSSPLSPSPLDPHSRRTTRLNHSHDHTSMLDTGTVQSLQRNAQSGSAAFDILQSKELSTPIALDRHDINRAVFYIPPTYQNIRNESGWLDEEGLKHTMYYLDHIYHRQFPFYRPSLTGPGRGWFLALLLRAKPFYAATLCLSACDLAQTAVGPLDGLPRPTFEELEKHHALSLIELQNQLKRLSYKADVDRIADTIEILACIVQLVAFEAFIPSSDMTNDWVMHLRAGYLLLSDLTNTIGTHVSPSYSSELSSPATKIVEGHRSEVLAFPAHEKVAFEFYRRIYVWYDILNSAALGLQPNPNRTPATLALLRDSDLNLKEIMGCEDWVMSTILEISILDDWKREMISRGTLSRRELSHRADYLEERLNAGLAVILARQERDDAKEAMTQRERDQQTVTEIFIGCALTHLYVVVSGFFPGLPEIQQSVRWSLERLEALPELFIRFVNWPLCVAGCLALKEDQARFCALVPPMSLGPHPLIMVRRTLEVIEKSWSLRTSQEESAETCSWTIAMEQLGTRYLFY